MTGIGNALNGPEAAPYIAKAGGTMTGALNLNTSSPSVDLQAASKGYVDSVAQGRIFKDPCVAASTVALTVTYNNGASGVGATLTNAGALAAISLDGVSPSVGDRVLIKNQASTFQNGIYTVTTVGSGAVAWVLTRATDMDLAAEFKGATTFLTGGTTQGSQTWTETAVVVTVGTDPVVFAQTGAGTGTVTSITAGQGITLTPSPITTTGSVALTVLPINPNTIIGGNFDTNPWQRGTSFTSVANGTYTADRFTWRTSGTGVVNVLKTADAPTVAQAGIFVQNCLNVDVTTADAAIGATDRYHWYYVVEGYDWAQLAQRAFTISFWVKSTVTGTYCVGFLNSGNDRCYVAEYTVNASDTWEYKTINVSASPSAGTWDYTNGAGLAIAFCVAIGSNFYTTANSWQVGGPFLSTSNQVNGMSSASNFFKLALIKLEPGSTATPWEIRSEQQELDLCRRYCLVISGVNNETVAWGSADTTSVAAVFRTFDTEMRAAPSFVIGAASDYRLGFSNTSSNATALTATVLTSKDITLAPTATGTPLTAGIGVQLRTLNTTGVMTFSAEL